MSMFWVRPGRDFLLSIIQALPKLKSRKKRGEKEKERKGKKKEEGKKEGKLTRAAPRLGRSKAKVTKYLLNLEVLYKDCHKANSKAGALECNPTSFKHLNTDGHTKKAAV